MKESGENYLEAVLSLSDSGEAVLSSDIARLLGVTRPSVHKAMTVLKERGYIDHEHYGRITLTEEGRTLALDVRERHRLLLGFLTKVLGCDADTAEQDACRMEHALSEQTLAQWKLFMLRWEEERQP